MFVGDSIYINQELQKLTVLIFNWVSILTVFYQISLTSFTGLWSDFMWKGLSHKIFGPRFKKVGQVCLEAICFLAKLCNFIRITFFYKTVCFQNIFRAILCHFSQNDFFYYLNFCVSNVMIFQFSGIHVISELQWKVRNNLTSMLSGTVHIWKSVKWKSHVLCYLSRWT